MRGEGREGPGPGGGALLLEEDGAGDGAEEGAAEGQADEVEGGEARGGDPADGDEGEARVDGDEQRRGEGALGEGAEPVAQQAGVGRDALVRVIHGGVAADPVEEAVRKVAAGWGVRRGRMHAERRWLGCDGEGGRRCGPVSMCWPVVQLQSKPSPPCHSQDILRPLSELKIDEKEQGINTTVRSFVVELRIQFKQKIAIARSAVPLKAGRS